MRRFFAGAGSALLLAGAGFFIWTGLAQDDEDPVPEPTAQSGAAPIVAGPPGRPPAADERSREQRRFDRLDRDNNGRIAAGEFLYARRRAFDRLDADHDGRLAFEEWAMSASRRFAEADSDHDAALSRAEFATTAPRRRPQTRQANCRC
ncbi:MAG TPA: EF-hand domain-containing protein [Allosphingosinicella sp.]|nr:EF-hand domain-containing protein [Allosphingosinicella sp.]